MAINEQQKDRIRGAITRLAQTSEYRTLRLFFLAESAAGNPDQQGLKALVLDLLGAKLDEEIESAVRTRRQEAGEVLKDGPQKFTHTGR